MYRLITACINKIGGIKAMTGYDVVYTVATSTPSNWYENLPLSDITTMAQNVAGQVGPVMIGVLVIVIGFGLVKKLVRKAAG